MGYRRGDPVIYKGKKYYVVGGPIMSTQGALYEISEVPPPIQGVAESDLQPAPKD